MGVLGCLGSILRSRAGGPAETLVKTCFGTDSLVSSWGSSTVCIGVFDGVHMGHRQVVRAAVEDAHRNLRPAIVLTFDRHPARTLRPADAPALIATLGQNLRALAECGADLTLVLAFDSALANTSAEVFTQEVVRGLLKAEHVVVGHDFALGKGREGTAEWLASRISTTVIEPFGPGGHRISSSEIRAAIVAGAMEEVMAGLGRPYALVGTVVAGERLGRELGFPTANLAPIARQVVPADGVYVGECSTPSGAFRAAISIGDRPTVGEGQRCIEAHLLNYSGEPLYGRCLELAFFTRVRDQLKFGDLDGLREQIATDIEIAKNYRTESGVDSSTVAQA